jgi:hypothetical protein
VPSVVFAEEDSGFVGNYDCTEMAYETYNILSNSCNVEICVGRRKAVDIKNAGIIEGGHAWINIEDVVFDPEVVVRKDEISFYQFLYTPILCGSSVLDLIKREQEYHNVGYDAFLVGDYITDIKTKKLIEIRLAIKYRKNKNYEWEYELFDIVKQGVE